MFLKIDKRFLKRMWEVATGQKENLFNESEMHGLYREHLYREPNVF